MYFLCLKILNSYWRRGVYQTSAKNICFSIKQELCYTLKLPILQYTVKYYNLILSNYFYNNFIRTC